MAPFGELVGLGKSEKGRRRGVGLFLVRISLGRKSS